MPRTLADDRVRGVHVDADAEQARYESGIAAGEAIIAKLLGDPALSQVRLVAASFEILETHLRDHRERYATYVEQFAAEARAVADRFDLIAARLSEPLAAESNAARPEQVAA